jgi:hypothetical protein
MKSRVRILHISVPQEFCEKYGVGRAQKSSLNNDLKNPYRIAAVLRFREDGPGENACDDNRGLGSPELCSEMAAQRGLSHYVKLNQRIFATKRLAEREVLASNILRSPKRLRRQACAYAT